MRTPLVLGCLIAAFAAFAGAARAEPRDPAKRAVRLAVYDLQASGVDERTATLVTEALLSELRKLERLSVLGMNEVRAMLSHEANKQLLGCTDDSCAAELAGALGVDELVIGSLGKVGDSHVFSAKRIDTARAATVQTATKRVPVVDGQEFLSLVDPVTAELYPDHPMRAGLVRGVNPEMVHLLNPPPLPRWVFFTTAGLGLALSAGGVGLKLSADAIVHEYETSTSIDGARRNEMQLQVSSRYGLANGLFISTGAAIAVLVVEALFTDWYGYRDWKPGEPVRF